MMKCGICKAETWTPKHKISWHLSPSYHFNRPIPDGDQKPRPIKDRADLRLHRMQDHPEEFKATEQKRMRGRKQEAQS